RRNAARLLEEKAVHPSSALPAGFFCDGATGNLMYQEEVNGDDEPPQSIFICSKLEVIACTRDESNKNHGRLLRFFDVDSHLQEWAMPMKMLAGSGLEYREALLDSGLLIAAGTKARNLLARYL